MKKFLIALLSILMVLTMVACGGATNGDNKGATKMTMGTGGTQGTYFAYGNVLSQYIKDKTNLLFVQKRSTDLCDFSIPTAHVV